ncbi:MAG: hypothetical protein AABZ76_04055 [Pseudomonadota bacterium]|jgi:hypothetical protein
MDLNELLFHHQASLMRAGAAVGRKDFDAHKIEAALYVTRIHALRRALGATSQMAFASA